MLFLFCMNSTVAGPGGGGLENGKKWVKKGRVQTLKEKEEKASDDLTTSQSAKSTLTFITEKISIKLTL